MESEPALTLRDLIEKAKAKHGTQSLRALARIGQATGGELSHNTMSSIYNGVYKARPGRRVLEEIAELAGVSYETAHQAAGLGTPHRPFSKQLPERVDELTPRHREVVLVVIRALLDAQASNSSGTVSSERPMFSHGRVNPKEDDVIYGADIEGIFGTDGLHRARQEG